jgi:hypothetical protein
MITAEDLAQWEDEARRAIHTCDTDDRIERLIQEVRAERDATDAYRAEMELLREQRDEAREVGRHLLKSVDCWSYQAELIEAYPWLKPAAPVTPVRTG